MARSCFIPHFLLVAGLILCLWGILPTSAQAGSWRFSIANNGSTASTTPNTTLSPWAPPAPANNTLSIPNWMVSVSLAGQPGQTCNLSAAMTIAFTVTATWVPNTSLPSDPAPSSLWVSEASSVGWNAGGGGSNGAAVSTSGTLADDGWQDPASAGTSAGTHVTQMPVSNGSATWSRRLTATVTARIVFPSNSYGGCGAGCSLNSYSVSALTLAATLQAASTGQPLSAAPAYFSGTGCSAQAYCPAISNHVAHAQLLVNGSVVAEYWDTAAAGKPATLPAGTLTGTNQTSTTLPASFDATGCPEGFSLPVQMQVWDSANNTYKATLSAPVHLPQLAVFVVWTPDTTVATPWPNAAATSGMIGGNTTVHVRLLYPPNFPSATLSSLTIQEEAGTASPPVVQNQTMNGVFNALCGDPDPAQPNAPPAAYLGIPWNLGGHNGKYDLVAVFHYFNTLGTPQTVSQTITVDREDLTITGTSPQDPTPITLDSTSNGGSPSIALSATVTAAYKANLTATVQIDKSDQTPVRKLSPSLPATVGGGGTPTTIAFAWDGRAEPTTDTNGHLVPGPLQDKGIYTFQYSIRDSSGGSDTEKSRSLSLPTPPSPIVELISANNGTANYNLTYLLSDTNNPPRPASAPST